jgi:hypothetical protein
MIQKRVSFLVSFDSITKNWKWFAEGALCISKQKFYELTQIPDSLPSSSLEYFGLNIIRSFNKIITKELLSILMALIKENCL